MIVLSSRDPRFASNAYVVATTDGEEAAVMDAGAPMGPLLEGIERHRLRPTHLFLTHRHADHVAHVAEWVRHFGCRVHAHPLEADHIPHAVETVEDGDGARVGGFVVRVLHVPGHTTGHAAFLVNDEAVFCGDTLFRGSVGGTVGPGHATFDDLRRSVLDVLLALPGEVAIFPGHMESTTVSAERASNPFVRAWLGLDPMATRRCEALGRRAALLLRATDYDGGTKCWVRFENGEEAVVPGSRVTDFSP